MTSNKVTARGSAAPEAFTTELKRVLQQVRAAFLDLMAAVGADPSQPQDVSRRFGVNRNLAWKLSKVINADDVAASVQHMPRPPAFELFLEAMARSGASDEVQARARTAMDAFDELVVRHAGDRATLELIVSGRTDEGLEHSRKLAYQGNRGTLGVQARVQLNTYLLAPSSDGDAVDVAQVSGLVDFRRLRSTARCLLLRHSRWTEDAPVQAGGEPLDPDCIQGAAPLLPQFCSQPTPQLEVVETAAERHFVLPGGPVGKTAAMTCLTGILMRRAGRRYATENDSVVSLGATTITPAETLQLDWFCHESMPWAASPELVVNSLLGESDVFEAAIAGINTLPTGQGVRELGTGLAPTVTTRVPRYRELLAWVFERVGWNPDEFVGVRVEMPYPPLPALVRLRADLPPAP